jgi:hypothetical protein
MLKSFITAFIICFVVIDPVGNATIFFAVTQTKDRARKLRTALEGAAISFVMALGAMLAAYFDERTVSSILFLMSILLRIGSMLLSKREIQIANTALNVNLSELESHQEWKLYWKPARHRKRDR